jgi:hypothetical protein
MVRALRVTLLAVAALTVTASGTQAAPSVKLSVHAERIPGFAHTGNIAGAGASVEIQLNIEGNEYSGHPPPLTELSLRLATGMRWDASGFPTCPPPMLGPHGCPRGSEAKPETAATLAVAFGAEVVDERATLNFRYHNGGRLELEIFGHSPVLIEVATIGGVKQMPTPTRGQLLSFRWPLVETVPNGPLASFTSLGIRLGSGFRLDPSTPLLSLRMPRRCPRGYLPYRLEASFAAVGGLPPQRTSASYRAPCPQGALHPR